ncbi:hypothetical protein RYZ26_15185 [Terasakiella sp. A23]|uniref:hypothetical protein n=1 Tax=Terasakiella sp. FCG-A23 TaxID=3080561 RepID=UPI002952C5A6|nr:hypothetical protein [Terasakiella sp. A23]MDV7340949.1 hypothetical protein [Terasakiella sp. A23]
MSTALVVFSDNAGVWWLKLLKPGFRHCFVILETDRGCIWLDPLSNNFTVKLLEGYELAGLLKWYRDQGMRVLKVNVDTTRATPHCWAPMTCVEVVKRLVGARDWRVLTPWQLYKALNKNKKRIYRKNYLTFGA